jgi:signal peptidase I
MEPSLKDGDILLVRKSDNMLWQYWNNKTSDKLSESVERTFQRDRLEEFEALHCSTTPSIIQKPPMPLTGDVVVYKDPRDYNPQQKMNIKRVVGLGGQIVRI